MKLAQLKLLSNKVLFEPVMEQQPKHLVMPQRDVPAPGNQKLWRVLKTGPKAPAHIKPGDLVAANLLNHDFVFPSGRVIASSDNIFLWYESHAVQPSTQTATAGR